MHDYLLGTLFDDASSWLYSEFNLKVEKSRFKQYSTENWQKFCELNGFDVKSDGLYVPQSYSAYVHTDSPVFISDTFHEFFGHGLFCEHSQIGQKLVEIVKKDPLSNTFLYEEVNPKEQPFGLCKQNIANYEGFALWLESLLCKETNNYDIWQLKKKRLPSDYVSLFEYFSDIEQKFTRFGFMSQLGFPKVYDDNKIINVLNKMYNINFENIEFAVLYGSQKPESDIDLFIVSSNPSTNYFNGWLDIYELNKEEFFPLAKKLDISVTDPIFSGKLIYGNKNHFEQLKQKINNYPITQESIGHNLLQAEQQNEYLSQLSNSKRKQDCLSYIESYRANAKELQKGNKILTLQNIKEQYP